MGQRRKGIAAGSGKGGEIVGLVRLAERHEYADVAALDSQGSLTAGILRGCGSVRSVSFSSRKWIIAEILSSRFRSIGGYPIVKVPYRTSLPAGTDVLFGAIDLRGGER